ncbi:hypothetical protein [Xenorhabdus bovienii]|uniref:hypothetical protein n=1 Tax=Xenorhabdus bovienii TaxID=40576 RepID=UPI00237CB49F|nr:hypothetical protein [Xenorhabdus bovienii]MDE1484649.1 hypothetical protein [Xenorhabdus bovienii]MDE9443976.1 hypothetical protein [Xenorhabdus bovienii]MDE9548900.1 hypothetical protein [Xenorhabdus bovienii]
MTNKLSFVDWYQALVDIAFENNGSVADIDAWRSEYEAGKTPLAAWLDENPPFIN